MAGSCRRTVRPALISSRETESQRREERFTRGHTRVADSQPFASSHTASPWFAPVHLPKHADQDTCTLAEESMGPLGGHTDSTNAASRGRHREQPLWSVSAKPPRPGARALP